MEEWFINGTQVNESNLPPLRDGDEIKIVLTCRVVKDKKESCTNCIMFNLNMCAKLHRNKNLGFVLK